MTGRTPPHREAMIEGGNDLEVTILERTPSVRSVRNLQQR